MQECLNKMLENLRAERASNKTVSVYTYFVKKFIEFCNGREPRLEDVVKFLNVFADRSVYTQYTVCYSLRYFFKVCPYVDPNLVPEPTRIREVRKRVIIPEEAIVEGLKRLPLKLAAMLGITYELGLRVTELCMLRYGDVNLNEWTVYVRRLKGSVTAVQPLVTDEVKNVLHEYMLVYKPVDPNDPLFPSKSGKPMNTSYASQVLKKALSMIGYPDAHPHDIRHSRATNLLKAGVDPVTVARILGHASLSSTLSYFHLIVDDVRRKLEEAKQKRI